MDKICREDVIMTLKHCIPDGVMQDVAVKNVQRISSVYNWHRACARDLPREGATILGAKIWQDKGPSYFVGDAIYYTDDGYKLVNSESNEYMMFDFWMYIPDIGD